MGTDFREKYASGKSEWGNLWNILRRSWREGGLTARANTLALY